MRLDPATQAKVWTAQAESVAKEVGATGDAVGKVVTAYKAARESHQEARRELMQNAAGDRMAMMQGMVELNDKETDKLKTAISGPLTDEQVKKALPVLGSFNNQWDGMVNTLSGFNLEADKQAKAMSHINAYVAASTKAMEEARASFDFQGMRSAMEEHRSALNTKLAEVLSEDQLAKWKEETERPRGPGGRGGRGPRGGGDN